MAAIRRVLCAGALTWLCAAGPAYAQKIPVELIYERYIISRPTERTPRTRLDWLTISAQLSDQVRIVSGGLWIPVLHGAELELLEETFAEWNGGPTIVRAGRLRTRFGFSDWSEQWYAPIILLPMVRNAGITTDGIGLTRFDSGIEVQTGTPNFQVTAALVDVRTGDRQVATDDPDHATVRLQTTIGGVMVGLNGLRKFKGRDQDAAQIAGLDVRWAVPYWQFRGELMAGTGEGDPGWGAYFDAFFRPAGLPRTQLALRIEQFEPVGSNRPAHLATAGFKQILTPELVFSINYADGSKFSPSETMRGWTSQLMFAIKVKS